MGTPLGSAKSSKHSSKTVSRSNSSDNIAQNGNDNTLDQVKQRLGEEIEINNHDNENSDNFVTNDGKEEDLDSDMSTPGGSKKNRKNRSFVGKVMSKLSPSTERRNKSKSGTSTPEMGNSPSTEKRAKIAKPKAVDEIIPYLINIHGGIINERGDISFDKAATIDLDLKSAISKFINDSNIEFTQTNSNGENLYHIICKFGLINSFATLIEKNKIEDFFESQNKNGLKPYELLIENKYFKLLANLFEKVIGNNDRRYINVTDFSDFDLQQAAIALAENKKVKALSELIEFKNLNLNFTYDSNSRSDDNNVINLEIFDINNNEDTQISLLHLAIAKNDVNLTNLLLNRNIRDDLGCISPAFIAAVYGSFDAFQLMYKHSQYNIKEEFHLPLASAAINHLRKNKNVEDRFKIIDIILTENPNIFKENQDGYNFLHKLAQKSDIELFEKIYAKYGKELRELKNAGPEKNPLILAIEKERFKVARAIFKYDLYSAEHIGADDRNLLQYLAHDLTDVIQSLNGNIGDKKVTKRKELIEMIFENGITLDPKMQDKKDFTVLHYIVNSPSDIIARHLFREYIKAVSGYYGRKYPQKVSEKLNELLSVQDHKGKTLLHHLAENYRSEIILDLLKHKPNVSIEDHQGNNFYYYMGDEDSDRRVLENIDQEYGRNILNDLIIHKNHEGKSVLDKLKASSKRRLRFKDYVELASNSLTENVNETERFAETSEITSEKKLNIKRVIGAIATITIFAASAVYASFKETLPNFLMNLKNNISNNAVFNAALGIIAGFIGHTVFSSTMYAVDKNTQTEKTASLSYVDYVAKGDAVKSVIER